MPDFYDGFPIGLQRARHFGSVTNGGGAKKQELGWMLGQPRASLGVLTRALCVLAVAAVALVAAQDAALAKGRH